jgi:hypothetical protein
MMTVENAQKEQALVKTVRAFRRVGWGFIVIGGGMLVIFLFTLFDPEGTIRVDGVEIRDFGTKLGVAAFLAVFPTVGSLLAFLPQKRIKSLFGNIYDQTVEISGTSGTKK